MKIRTSPEGGMMTVRPEVDRIDTANFETLKQRLVAAVDEGWRTLVVDLGAVQFMDSSGLGALISGLRRMEGRGEILLVDVQDPVRELLHLTQMERIFPTFPSAREARASRLGRVG